MASTDGNARPRLYAVTQRGIPVGWVRAPLRDPTATGQSTIRERLTELRLL